MYLIVKLVYGKAAALVQCCFFIDELYTMLCNCYTRGIQLSPSLTEIFLLMFADDITIISDTIIGLQRQLTVNVSTIKIIVFKRGGGLSRAERWTYNNCNIEVVNGFSYVGVFFTIRLSMHKMTYFMTVKAKSFFYIICLTLYNNTLVYHIILSLNCLIVRLHL